MQGEIARLSQKFKIDFEPTTQNTSKKIHLICELEDELLPCVPPLVVVIPENYPETSPECNWVNDEYSSSPFLSSIQQSLNARISKLSKQFSLSHLLDTWEYSVREACSPINAKKFNVTPVLVGTN